MNGQMLFDYLQGKWIIKREIINKVALSLVGNADGSASVTKMAKDTLSYKELLKVKWERGSVSKSHKEYDYILDDKGRLGLYEHYNGTISFMFNLLFGQEVTNIAKGQYQCINDTYSAVYEVINYNQFTVKFQINGPNKSYSIVSLFTRSGVNYQ